MGARLQPTVASFAPGRSPLDRSVPDLPEPAGDERQRATLERTGGFDPGLPRVAQSHSALPQERGVPGSRC